MSWWSPSHKTKQNMCGDGIATGCGEIGAPTFIHHIISHCSFLLMCVSLVCLFGVFFAVDSSTQTSGRGDSLLLLLPRYANWVFASVALMMMLERKKKITFTWIILWCMNLTHSHSRRDLLLVIILAEYVLKVQHGIIQYNFRPGNSLERI